MTVSVVAPGSTAGDGVGVVARLAAARPDVDVALVRTGTHLSTRWPAWLDNVREVASVEGVLEDVAAVIVPTTSPRCMAAAEAAALARVPIIGAIAVVERLLDVLDDDVDVAGVYLLDDDLDGYIDAIDYVVNDLSDPDTPDPSQSVEDGDDAPVPVSVPGTGASTPDGEELDG